MLDTTPGGAPTITSGPTDFSNDDTPTWAFNGEGGSTFTCEMRQGISIIFVFATCSSPKTYDLTARPDGTYTFAVKQKDAAQNESGEATDSYLLDRVKPGAPTAVTSTSHVPHIASKDTTIDMTWSEPTPADPSGIKGYCWSFSEDVDGGPDENEDAPETYNPQGSQCGSAKQATSASLNEGRYWFVVRAFDNTGNAAADTATYGPMIVDPQGSVIPLTPTLNDVLVAKSDTNGMEQYQPYRNFDLGTYTGYVNLHSGNLVAQGTDVVVPGKGLNTVLSHTYNSQRNDARYHDNGLGLGWSLSLSDADAGLDGATSVTDIDINAPVVPTLGDVAGAVGGALGGILELTDGDGTVHRFIRKGAPGTRWESPPGVNLRVKENLDPSDPTETMVSSYDIIRPDGVVYHVEQVPTLGGLSGTWHVSTISDRHGNQLKLNYTELQDIPQLSLSKLRVTSIDNNRAAANPVVTLDYSTTGTLQSIVSLEGSADERVVEFGYANNRLSDVTESAQAPVADQRVTRFAYEDHERNAVDPTDDVFLLRSIDDAIVESGDTHGNRTRFEYDDGAATGHNRLVRICDRDDMEDGNCSDPWRVVYGGADPNTGERTTTYTSPEDDSVDYLISGHGPVSQDDPRITGGNILQITDEGSPAVTSTYRWVENRLVEKTNGVGDTTNMTYNDLGLVTSLDAPAPNRSSSELPGSAPTERITTTFVYDPVQEDPDSDDPDTDPDATYTYELCEEPSSSGEVTEDLYCDSVAEMVRQTSADGRSDARISDFTYEAPTGDIDTVIQRAGDTALPYNSTTRRHEVQPKGAEDRLVDLDHFDFGGLQKVDGPRTGVNDVTTYSDYTTAGLPQTVTDATANSKHFTYDPYGNVLTSVDRGGRETTMTYDARSNMVTSEDAAGHTTTFRHDLNDNLISVTSPKGLGTSNFTNSTDYNPNEWPLSTEGPGATETERISTTTAYNRDGTIATSTGPTGAETSYTYFPNRAVHSVSSDAGTGDLAVATYSYDAAGRKSSTALPAVNGTDRPTSSITYTPAGAVESTTETSAVAADRVTRFAYDAFGERVQVLGPRSKSGHDETLQQVYDPFGEMTEMRRLLDTPSGGSRWLIYTYSYDAAGNRTSASQPTGDGDTLTATYTYDVLSRMVEQTDPQNPGHRTEFTLPSRRSAGAPLGLQRHRAATQGEDGVQRRLHRGGANRHRPEGSGVPDRRSVQLPGWGLSGIWLRRQPEPPGHPHDRGLDRV